MFGLIRKLRRRKLAKRPFPEAWLAPLQEHVPFFAPLEGELRECFFRQLKFFVWEKTFIGAGGLEVTDEMRVVIAATAVRLTLHLDLDYYARLTEVIVYPSAYKHPDDDESMILGEAQDWGTVVLAWDAVLAGLKNTEDGLDTATHEFAHVLDRGGGA
ncbi:MAG: zinc-dependent peptidase, partial [Deltaproteobacteria bacterium]|nr:zinc-dependent peptidase [Deltaproteobacteria bacterium]